jgi:excisionase family DNA binding protein
MTQSQSFPKGAIMPHTSAAPVHPNRLIPLADAAEHFHVSVKTLRRRIADGTIAGYRVGRLIRVDLDELTQSLVVAIPSARSV